MAISTLMSRAATSTPEVIVDDGGVRWCGPIAPEAPSALVEWRLERAAPAGEAFAAAVAAADPIAIGAAARALPMPALLVDALAARCLDAHRQESLAVASGTRDADARWAAALTRVARARGLGSAGTAADAAPEVVLTAPAGRRLTHLRELPDGGVAVLDGPDGDATSGAQLWLLGPDGARTSLPFAGAAHTDFALPTPVRADPSLVVVTAYLEESRVATAWLVRGGRVEQAWRARVDSQPQEFSICDAGLWLHCEQQHALLDGACVLAGDGAGGEPREPTACARGSDWMRGKLQTLGSWLPVFSRPLLQQGRGWISEQLSWVDLDGRHERIRVPWGHEHHQLAITADAIYVTADDGLWRLVPGAAPEWLSELSCFGILVDGDTIWTCSGSRLMRIDRASGRLLLQVDAGGWDVVRLGGQIVTVGGVDAGWFRFDEAGHLIERADKGRESACARLADGTVALSAGAQVAVFAADGTLRRRLQLPYDGLLVGATTSHFIYGPTDGGIERDRPDALYAIDGEGNLSSRATPARRPTRIFYGGGSTKDDGRIGARAVWLMPYGEPLRRWTPAATVAAEPPLPERKRRVESGAREVGPNTVNPRDDWPEPGRRVVAEDFVGIDGTYGGTTGVCPAPAIEAEDRSTATLVGCTLVNGGWLRLKSSSTILLFGCTIVADPVQAWETGPRCQIVLVDCRFEGEARIRLDADAHLSIDDGTAHEPASDGCIHLGPAPAAIERLTGRD